MKLDSNPTAWLEHSTKNLFGKTGLKQQQLLLRHKHSVEQAQKNITSLEKIKDKSSIEYLNYILKPNVSQVTSEDHSHLIKKGSHHKAFQEVLLDPLTEKMIEQQTLQKD